MTRKLTDKEKITREIRKAAQLYKQNLVGKKFIYVFEGKYIEVLYKAINFKLLTGVECQLSAKDFYRFAVNNRLHSSQINFSSQHPYSLCKRKLKHLIKIPTLATSENFMLEEISTRTRSFKFGTTDLNFSICLNKETDADGNEKGDCYVVESLRDEDCFNKSRNIYSVTHILSKENTAKTYSDVLFVDQSLTLKDLPVEVLNMIDEDLLRQVSENDDG